MFDAAGDGVRNCRVWSSSRTVAVIRTRLVLSDIGGRGFECRPRARRCLAKGSRRVHGSAHITIDMDIDRWRCLEDGLKPAVSFAYPKKNPTRLATYRVRNTGGAGRNRTAVRKSSTDSSTCVAGLFGFDRVLGRSAGRHAASHLGFRSASSDPTHFDPL